MYGTLVLWKICWGIRMRNKGIDAGRDDGALGLRYESVLPPLRYSRLPLLQERAMMSESTARMASPRTFFSFLARLRAFRSLRSLSSLLLRLCFLCRLCLGSSSSSDELLDAESSCRRFPFASRRLRSLDLDLDFDRDREWSLRRLFQSGLLLRSLS